jgi:bifunctional non-homologous end joining protein LigD
MRGKKLNGEWILVKDRREPESNKWLLIKAGAPMPAISPKADDTSAISGRSLREIARANDAQWQSNRPAATSTKRWKRAAENAVPVRPAFVVPMQCKPVTTLPSEAGWTFEIKFDGYRCIAIKRGDKLTLLSRNEKVLNSRFPLLVKAVGELPGDFVLDGEIVALDGDGRPSFQLLQNNQSRSVPVYFYAFDLLNHDGRSFLIESIENRRAGLEALLHRPPDLVRLSPLLEARAGQVLEAVRKLGLEGVVGKRHGSIYEPAKRSGAWIKHRPNNEQEFVIGGYVPGARGFDALLVGLYEKKKLIFVAKVKNGFVPRLRDALFPQLKRLAVAGCPFANLPETKASSRWGESLTAEKMKECRWVKPKLVCQVGFVEWTDANHLRHCTFIGMRDDKDAREVTR